MAKASSPRLSVNINKVALLRNARGGNVPNVLQVAQDCERFGAQGITVHPRPDERHIRRDDLAEIKAGIGVEFNVEGYPSDEFIQLVERVKPAQVTLVPDPPGVLTSSEGWDTLGRQDFLKAVIGRLKGAGMRTSIFLETEPELVEGALATGTDRIELYTGPFAQAPRETVQRYRQAAEYAHKLGLGVNAGHDLNQANLPLFVQEVPHIAEVSIGHALIAEALYDGLERTIASYLEILN